jgi:two-component system chemotaxis response regulator CheY
MTMAKKVMVVDDSRTMRQQVGIVLTGAGFEVIEAEDGIDGLEKVRQATDLAMVLCDVNMPRMDGLDMLATLKSEARFSELPFLMLTTEAQPALITRAKQAGAKGWIVKPFKPELLVAAVRRLVGAD